MSVPVPVPEFKFLAFGIPSLDKLLGHRGSASERVGVDLRPDKDGDPLTDASVCVIGPDGTGKSVFALHLASEHWRVCADWWHGLKVKDGHKAPKIIYASTDLSLSMAQTMWRHFWLDRPYSRRSRLPFEGDGDDGTNWVQPKAPPAPGKESAEFEKNSTDQTRHGVHLKRHRPSEKEELARFLDGATHLGNADNGGDTKEVAFIDLESDTSGDDWAFLNRLLHALPTPEPGEPLHMLVIDAIEGLETLAGRQDSFGEPQDRRARVAQLIRAASGKCHLVVVVEEPKNDERLPEVFVADLVVRLRTTMEGDYSRRSVEIEKVRGQKHTRGQHDFRMRGPLTGATDKYTPDYPAAGRLTDPTDPKSLDYLSHIVVFPSLHQIARSDDRSNAASPAAVIRGLDGNRRGSSDDQSNAASPAAGPPTKAYTGFGIYHLDAMLGDISDTAEPRHPGFDDRGLPAGSITTIIGREATHKARLGRAFLAMAFRTRYGPLGTLEKAANLLDPLLGQGVAILLTTTDVRHGIKEKLKRHMIPESFSTKDQDGVDSVEWGAPSHEDGLEKRLIVRYLETHHQTAAILLHIIKQLVVEAKRRLAEARQKWIKEKVKSNRNPKRKKLRKVVRDLKDKDGKRMISNDQIAKLSKEPPKIENARIRLVIDDWASILSTFPEVRSNPKFLPALVHYLKGEGVSTLILANHQGNPSEELKDGLDPHFQELRSLSDYCLHTWQVSFFDERKVAITLLPPIQPGVGQQVRELRPARMSETRSPRTVSNENQHPLLRHADERATYDAEQLTIDPHFELYSGLETGRPGFIPLHVYLYAERDDIPAFQGYLGEIKDRFKQLFRHDGPETVLQPQYGPSYDALREYSYLQSESRLDHTLVLQVDEFWAESRAELRRLEVYLNARTVDYDDRPELREDPFGLFGLTEAMKQRREPRQDLYYIDANEVKKQGQYHGPLKRRQFFDPVGYSLETIQKRYPVFKVPYTWDFGFLVCDAIAWEKYGDKFDHRTERVRQLTVELYDKATQGSELKGLVNVGSVAEKTRVESIWVRMTRIIKWNIEDNSLLQRGRFDADEKDRNDRGYPTQQFINHTWLRYDMLQPSSPTPKAVRNQFVPYKTSSGENVYLNANVVSVPSESMTEAESKKIDEFDRESPSVSWREFLGACCTIARESNGHHSPFDVDMMAVESLSCLVFEVWMSELHQTVKEVAAEKRKLYKPVKANKNQPIYVCSDSSPAGKMKPPISIKGMLLNEFELYEKILDHLNDETDADGKPHVSGKVPPHERNRFWPRARRDDWTTNCLAGLLDENKSGKIGKAIAKVFRRALYRAMLLLSEVLDIERMSEPDLNLRPRTGAGNAAATRHWYSTATATMAAADCRGKVVAGLPGNFAVRGDWFLAIARGSRSPRLGERAMDILCSKRGNITRLQHGLGLPVRDLSGPADKDDPEAAHPHLQKRIEYWTSLPYVEDDGTRHNIHYRELRALGARDIHPGKPEPRDHSAPEQIGRSNFQWFWRSSIESYDTHARIWQRWLCMVLRNWKTRWPRPKAPEKPDEKSSERSFLQDHEWGHVWRDGFREYDFYRRREMHPASPDICYVDEDTDRYKEYSFMLDGLIETLDRANSRAGS